MSEHLKNYLNNSPFAITKLCKMAKLQVGSTAVAGWLKGKPLAKEHIEKLESYLIAHYGYAPEKEDKLTKLLAMQAEIERMIEEEKNT